MDALRIGNKILGAYRDGAFVILDAAGGCSCCCEVGLGYETRSGAAYDSEKSFSVLYDEAIADAATKPWQEGYGGSSFDTTTSIVGPPLFFRRGVEVWLARYYVWFKSGTCSAKARMSRHRSVSGATEFLLLDEFCATAPIVNGSCLPAPGTPPNQMPRVIPLTDVEPPPLPETIGGYNSDTYKLHSYSCVESCAI